MFSIIIPTFNNLEYLKLCIKSIRQNSIYNHQIIPHVNIGEDGTCDFLQDENIDFTFTKNIFWSTLIQYSNLTNNLGINSRLQWRFAPLSDLYLVYNDNYYTQDFGPVFRSINLKLTYWLNI